MRTLAIVGAGGNAREIAAVARSLGYQVVGFLADRHGSHDSPTLGDFSWLEHNKVDCLAMGIGSPEHKLRIGSMLASLYPRLEWPVLISPSAHVDSSCSFEAGVIVCVGALATVNVAVGRFSQLNFGCTVGHEVKIGEGCLINPGANVAGGVTIGDGALIGSGAQILQYLTVGPGATVGSGSVVTHDVPAGMVVCGIPARQIVR